MLIIFLSYIPNIGIIVACIPAGALALIQHGVVAALLVVGLTAINYLGDYALTAALDEPRAGAVAIHSLFLVFVWGICSVPWVGCCRCR